MKNVLYEFPLRFCFFHEYPAESSRDNVADRLDTSRLHAEMLSLDMYTNSSRLKSLHQSINYILHIPFLKDETLRVVVCNTRKLR